MLRRGPSVPRISRLTFALRAVRPRFLVCRFRRWTGFFRDVFCRLHCRRIGIGGEILYAPPYWVHALLWGPLILLTTLAPLRPLKGLLIALQYHHKAAESRFTGGDGP